jgi:hypothetical protein
MGALKDARGYGKAYFIHPNLPAAKAVTKKKGPPLARRPFVVQ